MTCDPGCTCRGTYEPGTPEYDEAILRALDLISTHTQREAEARQSKQRHPSSGKRPVGGWLVLPGGGGE